MNALRFLAPALLLAACHAEPRIAQVPGSVRSGDLAMWSEQASGAIVAGLVAGSVVLAAVAYWMLRMSKRLPLGRFFSIVRF